MVVKTPQCEKVTRWSQTGYLAQRHSCHMGMMPKWFALMDVRQVDFNGGQAHSGNRIADRNARMSVGGRIDDNAVIASPALLNPVHQVAFAIRLANVDVHPQIFGQRGEGRVDALERLSAIDGLFPGTEQIQVGSM
jgi:hypothetical protein